MKIDVKSEETDGAKPPTAWHKKDDLPFMTMRQLLKPLLIFMAIGGSYTYVPTGRNESKGRPYRILGIAYRLFTIVTILLWCVKQFTAIFIRPSDSWQFSTIFVCCFMVVFLGLLIFCKSNHIKYGNQRMTFNFWDEKIRPALKELEIEFPEEKIKRRLNIYLIMITCTFTCNTVGLGLLNTDTLSDGYRVTLAAPFSPSLLTIVCSIYMMSVLAFVWFIHILYVVMMSTILISTFELFNQYLEKHIADSSFRMTCKFKKIRQLHLNLSKMVSDLDKDLKYYYATSIVLNVGISSFILYHIIKTPMGTFDLLMFVFWQILTLVSTGIVNVFAALVNESVSTHTWSYFSMLVTVRGSFTWCSLYYARKNALCKK